MTLPVNVHCNADSRAAPCFGDGEGTGAVISLTLSYPDCADIKVDPSLFPKPELAQHRCPQTQAVGPHLGQVGGSCPPPQPPTPASKKF